MRLGTMATLITCLHCSRTLRLDVTHKLYATTL